MGLTITRNFKTWPLKLFPRSRINLNLRQFQPMEWLKFMRERGNGWSGNPPLLMMDLIIHKVAITSLEITVSHRPWLSVFCAYLRTFINADIIRHQFLFYLVLWILLEIEKLNMLAMWVLYLNRKNKCPKIYRNVDKRKNLCYKVTMHGSWNYLEIYYISRKNIQTIKWICNNSYRKIMKNSENIYVAKSIWTFILQIFMSANYTHPQSMSNDFLHLGWREKIAFLDLNINFNQLKSTFKHTDI